MSGGKGMKDFPSQVKMEALRLYQEEGRTQSGIMEILGVSHKTQIQVWLRKYRESMGRWCWKQVNAIVYKAN